MHVRKIPPRNFIKLESQNTCSGHSVSSKSLPGLIPFPKYSFPSFRRCGLFEKRQVRVKLNSQNYLLVWSLDKGEWKKSPGANIFFWLFCLLHCFGQVELRILIKTMGQAQKSNQNKSFLSIYYLWSTTGAIWSSWRYGLTSKVPRVDKKAVAGERDLCELIFWSWQRWNLEAEAEG